MSNFFLKLIAYGKHKLQPNPPNVPEDTAQVQRIAQLAEENALLQTKVDTLMAMVGKV